MRYGSEIVIYCLALCIVIFYHLRLIKPILNLTNVEDNVCCSIKLPYSAHYGYKKKKGGGWNNVNKGLYTSSCMNFTVDDPLTLSITLTLT